LRKTAAWSGFVTLLVGRTMKHIKIVLVGDGPVHKEFLLVSYAKIAFPDAVKDETGQTASGTVVFEDTQIDLELFTGPDVEVSEETRHGLYRDTDVFVLCFSLVSEFSFEHIRDQWVPELKKFCPLAPSVLVGTARERRDNFKEHEDEYRSKGWYPISTEKAEELRTTINAQFYIECSSQFEDHAKEVFETAIKVALHPPPPPPPPAKVEEKGEGGKCEIA
jgi:Ras-related C3 botulinum toxin substrate 1